MVQNGRNKIHVEVINASDFVKKDMVDKKGKMESIVDALRKQVGEHFTPAWGIDAEVAFNADPGPVNCVEMRKSCNLPRGAWWLLILDRSDQAGFLGYHDVTDEGLPLAKVFAQTAEENGRPWTVVASHELLEMLVDPGMSLAVVGPTQGATGSAPTREGTGRLYAYEICDPCDADQYDINGVQVSNFVYPAWFEWFHDPDWYDKSNNQLIHREHVARPFELRPGGFINVLDIPSGIGWHQIYAQGKSPNYNERSRVGSRRERRRILGSVWPWPPSLIKSG